ncbi:hypothetical protein B0T24DRAFT_610817 [Lasiosphaeria ovina]|uniref:AAA+ ATPase lid domain-containing protein n=1 Tax=Lasiosphaeria ovina TaxID=92902 RepID=A0AAE0NCQ6_9PEZI|nr:hypothetical protein B0T24DRAFT_610817 [Lasiosphaeria ovina]
MSYRSSSSLSTPGRSGCACAPPSLSLARLSKKQLISQGRKFNVNEFSVGGFATNYWQAYPNARLNGRQIRNACQIFLALADFEAQGGNHEAIMDLDVVINLEVKHFQKVSDAYLSFMKYLKDIYGVGQEERAREKFLRAGWENEESSSARLPNPLTTRNKAATPSPTHFQTRGTHPSHLDPLRHQPSYGEWPVTHGQQLPYWYAGASGPSGGNSYQYSQQSSFNLQSSADNAHGHPTLNVATPSHGSGSTDVAQYNNSPISQQPQSQNTTGQIPPVSTGMVVPPPEQPDGDSRVSVPGYTLHGHGAPAGPPPPNWNPHLAGGGRGAPGPYFAPPRSS